MFLKMNPIEIKSFTRIIESVASEDILDCHVGTESYRLDVVEPAVQVHGEGVLQVQTQNSPSCYHWCWSTLI